MQHMQFSIKLNKPSVLLQILYSCDIYIYFQTRILVSNNITYLPQVDYILMLEEGQVIERGTFAQLMEKNGSFSSFVKGIVTEKNDENGEYMRLGPMCVSHIYFDSLHIIYKCN